MMKRIGCLCFVFMIGSCLGCSTIKVWPVTKIHNTQIAKNDATRLSVPISIFSELAMVSSLDAQRLFLQSVISRRVLSVDLAKVLWKQCVEAVKGLDRFFALSKV